MTFHRSIADPENFNGFSTKMMEDYCDELIARVEKGECMVVFAEAYDKQIAGFASCYTKKYDAETSKYVKKTAIIDEIYVKEDF